MINSPFDRFGGPVFEEISGSFACQTKGCFDHVATAKYNDKEKLLTWQCPEGHTSIVEDFDYRDYDIE